MRVLVVVRPGRDRRQLGVIVRWLRALVPTVALLIASPDARPLVSDDDETIVIDTDDIASGPLSLADALTRATGRRSGP